MPKTRFGAYKERSPEPLIGQGEKGRVREGREEIGVFASLDLGDGCPQHGQQPSRNIVFNQAKKSRMLLG